MTITAHHHFNVSTRKEVLTAVATMATITPITAAVCIQNRILESSVPAQSGQTTHMHIKTLSNIPYYSQPFSFDNNFLV